MIPVAGSYWSVAKKDAQPSSGLVQPQVPCRLPVMLDPSAQHAPWMRYSAALAGAAATSTDAARIAIVPASHPIRRLIVNLPSLRGTAPRVHRRCAGALEREVRAA